MCLRYRFFVQSSLLDSEMLTASIKTSQVRCGNSLDYLQSMICNLFVTWQSLDTPDNTFEHRLAS